MASDGVCLILHARPLVNDAVARSFPKNVLVPQATGRLLHNVHIRAILLARFLLRLHHIFMQALTKLRCVSKGCSDARCFAAFPFGLCAVSPEFCILSPDSCLSLHAPCSMPRASSTLTLIGSLRKMTGYNKCTPRYSKVRIRQ